MATSAVSPVWDVEVDGHTFEVSKVLGRGAFGVVWEAREFSTGMSEVLSESSREDSDELPARRRSQAVALKCTGAATQTTLKLALHECEVLQSLTMALSRQEDLALARRVPRYLAHASAADKKEVHLVMSKIEGRPLDQWLYGISDQRLMDISVSTLLDGPLPGSRRGSRTLEGAGRAAVGLLGQLAPVFAVLDPIAFHRDVSAHNLLVAGGLFVGDRLEFSLIDFGLAVPRNTWKEEWKSSNLAGDPRYWAPATWIQFAHGSKHLEAYPDAGYRRQYEERIDHYALGILSLEVFFTLWEGPSHDSTCGDAMAKAHAAWRVYWATAYDLFQRFHGRDGGGHASLRNQLAASSDELAKLIAASRTLCLALRVASRRVSDSQVSSFAASALLVASELIDVRCSLSWAFVPDLLAASAATAAPLALPSPSPACSADAEDIERRWVAPGGGA